MKVKATLASAEVSAGAVAKADQYMEFYLSANISNLFNGRGGEGDIFFIVYHKTSIFEIVFIFCG